MTSYRDLPINVLNEINTWRKHEKSHTNERPPNKTDGRFYCSEALHKGP
jgi:hypothetical protein